MMHASLRRLLVSALVIVLLVSRIPSAYAWKKFYGAYSATSVVLDSNQDVIAAGGTFANYGGTPAVFKLRAADGEQLWRYWVADYPGGGINSYPYDQVVTDLHGDVIVVHSNSITKRSGTDGALLWQGAGMVGLGRIAVDEAGDVLSAGDGLRVAKISGLTGVPIWSSPPVSDGDTAVALAVDQVGNVVVGGRFAPPGGQALGALVKLSGTDGSTLWTRQLSGFQPPPGSNQTVDALTIDGAGNVVLVATLSNANTSGDIAALKFSADGTELWRHVINGEDVGAGAQCNPPVLTNFDDYGLGVALRGSTVAVRGKTGLRLNCTPLNDLKVAKLASVSGAEAWSAPSSSDFTPFVEPGHDGNEGESRGEALAVDSMGDIVASGRFLRPGGDGRHLFGVLKISGADGSLLWRTTIGEDVVGTGIARSVVIDSADNVVAAGETGRTYSCCGSYATFTVVKLRGSDGADFLEVTDQAAPTVQADGDLVALANQWLSDEELSVDVVAHDDESGVAAVRLYVTNSEGTSVVAEKQVDCGTGSSGGCPTDVAETLEVEVEALPEGVSGFRVAALDGAGNSGQTSNWDIYIDHTPPNTPTVSVASDAGKLEMSWGPVADNPGGSEVDHYEYQVAVRGRPTMDWQSTRDPLPFLPTGLRRVTTVTTSDGRIEITNVLPAANLSVQVRAVDRASNQGQAAKGPHGSRPPDFKDCARRSPCGTFGHSSASLAAAYAIYYADSSVRTDPRFPRIKKNDCTNFISAAYYNWGPHQGGFGHMREFKKGTDSWWAKKGVTYRYTHSWAVVKDFREHQVKVGRMREMGALPPAQWRLADAIVFGWGDSENDHMAMVTSVGNDPGLSSHGNDRVDLPWSQFKDVIREDHPTFSYTVLRPRYRFANVDE